MTLSIELTSAQAERLRALAQTQGMSTQAAFERIITKELEESAPLVQSEKVASSPSLPNERLLATLERISAMNAGRPVTTDGSDTKRLLEEARAGAMYGYEPTK